jgi:hypothetical protein
MKEINLALEWFLNPDHLPMIAGLQKSEYEKAGLKLNIIVPKEHYDGFEELKKAKIDIHCNEPIHLFEHYFDGIKSLGCFFETRGGVMIKKSSIEKLRNNEKIRITTPASNEVTNKIGFEILKRYAKKENFVLDRKNVEFVQTDFWHIKNLKNGDQFDGAWLCFYNFEGIEAKHENLENIFIDQYASPYPNFSALEFITSAKVLETKGDALNCFIKVTEKMAKYCKENIDEAKKMYYEYSKENKSELMDKIIEDTIPRFNTTISPDENKWSSLFDFLKELDVVDLSKNEYKSIW